MKKEIIFVSTLCFIAILWSLVFAEEYYRKPKIIERIKEIEVSDTYYDGVKVNGECALTVPPCWEYVGNRSVLRLYY